jgi:ankyrin repeat protein
MIEPLLAAKAELGLQGFALAEQLLALMRHDQFRAAECFFIAGADVNVRDFNGRTLLHWATAEGREGFAALLRRQDGVDESIPDPMRRVEAL